MKYERTGQVIVVTGDGKGKTTTALGLAVQTAAQGQTVKIVQFLKGGGYTGELTSCRLFGDNMEIHQFGYGCPIAAAIKAGDQVCTKCGLCFRENRNPQRNYAGQALAMAQRFAADPSVNLLILDEVSHAIRRELIAEAAVLELVYSRQPAMTIVLTGRNMPDAINGAADSVTWCAAVKHPMQAGIDGRRGIEY